MTQPNRDRDQRVADGRDIAYELPAHTDLPNGSAWGLFGDADELGTLRLGGRRQVRDAAALVRHGLVFPLSMPIELPDPPILGRLPLVHTVTGGDNGFVDDRYDRFYPQASSQWDALGHAIDPATGAWNGAPPTELAAAGGTRLGIDSVARHGIAGRFVLVDVAGHREALGRPIDPAVSTAIGVRELDDVLAAQGVALDIGDILLLRTGWVGWYERQGAAVRAGLGHGGQFPAPGLAPTEATAAWLWDHRVAAVAADNPALEMMPIDLDGPGLVLHFLLIARLGITVGELFRLDPLAAACRELGAWDGLLAAAPLNKRAGVGSPANALAFL